MKPLYRTAFFLQRPPATLDEIAAVVEEWIFVRQGKPRSGLTRPEGWKGQAISRPFTILGAGWSVEAIFSQEPTQALWAVQVQHPDSEDESALGHQPDGRATGGGDPLHLRGRRRVGRRSGRGHHATLQPAEHRDRDAPSLRWQGCAG